MVKPEPELKMDSALLSFFFFVLLHTSVFSTSKLLGNKLHKILLGRDIPTRMKEEMQVEMGAMVEPLETLVASEALEEEAMEEMIRTQEAMGEIQETRDRVFNSFRGKDILWADDKL